MGNKIICGDALTELKKLENNTAAIIFTSPPYNTGTNGYLKVTKRINGKVTWLNSKEFKENQDMTVDSRKYMGSVEVDIKKDWKDWLKEIILVGIEKAQYFFLNVQELSKNKKDIITLRYELRDYYCDNIIWNKTNGIPNGFNERVMTGTYENIYIFSKIPSRAVGTKKWKSTVKNLVTLKGNQSNAFSKVHKAMFPIELPLYIIENFTNENDLIIDCFSGLGTTGVAAKILNRNYIGIELNQTYCDIAKERIENEKERMI